MQLKSAVRGADAIIGLLEPIQRAAQGAAINWGLSGIEEDDYPQLAAVMIHLQKALDAYEKAIGDSGEATTIKRV